MRSDDGHELEPAPSVPEPVTLALPAPEATAAALANLPLTLGKYELISLEIRILFYYQVLNASLRCQLFWELGAQSSHSYYFLIATYYLLPTTRFINGIILLINCIIIRTIDCIIQLIDHWFVN